MKTTIDEAVTDRTSCNSSTSTSDFAYWFERGRKQGVVDKFLGQNSPWARETRLPGYAEGYRAGRE